MKRIILLISIFVLAAGIAFADENKDANKKAVNNMLESHRYYHDLCARAADNFRADSQFSGYIRGKCILYESDRQRLLNSVFPITNKAEKSYKEQMPVLMSNFAIEMNNKEVESLKLVINEYCKYNQYKFDKRSPEACTAATIEKLFRQ